MYIYIYEGVASHFLICEKLRRNLEDRGTQFESRGLFNYKWAAVCCCDIDRSS